MITTESSFKVQYGDHEDRITQINDEIEKSFGCLKALKLDEVFELSSMALPADCSIESKNEFIEAAKKLISKFLLMERGRTASYRDYLQQEADFFHEEATRKETQLKSLPEFEAQKSEPENSNGRPRKWTKHSTYKAFFYYLLLLTALTIELFVSYELLRANVVSFHDNAILAGMMGMISIFAALVLKFLHRKISVSTQKTRWMWIGSFFFGIIMFFSFQYVIYNLQLPPSSNTDVTTLEGSRFSKPLISNNLVTQGSAQKKHMQSIAWEATYYFVASLIIGVLVFVVAGALADLYASHDDIGQRTAEFERLNREYKYCLDSETAARSTLARCPLLDNAIVEICDALAEKAWFMMCERKRIYDEKQMEAQRAHNEQQAEIHRAREDTETQRKERNAAYETRFTQIAKMLEEDNARTKLLREEFARILKEFYSQST